MADSDLIARVAPAVGAFPAAEWDRLAGTANPFVSHAFLTALEDSASVGPGTGWSPAPLVIEDGRGTLLGALPAYIKGHSQGEYVFDHAWADAWHRAGGDYYPKLQIAAPFTPATGPRLLLEDEAYAAPLLRAAESLCRQHGLSSAHATFIEPGQRQLFARAGWLLRNDIQFHWENRDYASFDDFLGQLSSRKRKDMRKERQRAQRRRRDPPYHRRRPEAGALGRVLAVLPGHRRAQMGPALPDARGRSTCSASGWPTGSCW